MDRSPSPTSPLGGRRSPTPPAQPLSKRDKRRNQHVALQQSLQHDFGSKAEHHLRSYLISLQRDVNLVTQADPYNPEPLEDGPGEIERIVEAQAEGTPYQSELSSMAGTWYTSYIHEINEAKQEREIQLAQLQQQHGLRLERLKYECDYRLDLAARESRMMTDTLRERLFNTLSNKRQKLMKEKEQLDIADTNALLLHPNQFSITNPASPGNGPTVRKTRLTRHRGEQDESAAANNHNGEGTGNNNNANKRKRKFGGGGDDDYGSPSRNGFATPAERAKQANIAAQTDKVYSINQLFTEKELNFQSHQAQIASRHFFTMGHKEKEKQDADTNGHNNHGNGAGGDHGSDRDEHSDAEGDDDLEAPGMERSASQNVHVTRSTRNGAAAAGSGLAGLNILSDVAEKAAPRPALPYATLYTHNGKNATFLPQVSRLMAEEIDEDLQRITEMKSQEPGTVDKKMVEEALQPVAGARSTLAPDWPVYLDVHLVDIDPRNTESVGLS